MHTAFQHNQYLLTRQVFALTGRFRVYDPMGNLVLFSEQKMLVRLEDIRVYSDESQAQELLIIKARQSLEFSGAHDIVDYDVVDSATNQTIGVLRRKVWRSLYQCEQWELLDANEQVRGRLFEDTMRLALLRRLLLGSWLLLQNYNIAFGGTRVASLRKRFHLFRYALDLDSRMDPGQMLDRRLGIAAGILLAIVEEKQSN